MRFLDQAIEGEDALCDGVQASHRETSRRRDASSCLLVHMCQGAEQGKVWAHGCEIYPNFLLSQPYCWKGLGQRLAQTIFHVFESP